ncbi:MAG: PH domain-containing protein [Oscillospiraceae bacterium]|nr:PH domain-containing protein [Oscillospiraceae bacterium]
MNELWRDRKRHLGLPLSFTRYSLTEDRIFMETGLLNTELEEILLYRVRDIGMKISLGQRIFGVGTVVLVSSDKTAPKLELKNIRNPRLVKEQIHQQVEEMKIKRRLRVGEVLEDGAEDGLDEEEDDSSK